MTSRQTRFQPCASPCKGAMTLDDMLKAAYSLGTGRSVRDVCHELNPTRSPATVHKIKKRATDPGEKRDEVFDFTRPILAHFIAFCLLVNPQATGQNIAEKAKQLGIQTSKATVNRIAKEMRFESVLSQKQEKLTQDQKLYRIMFCLQIPRWVHFRLPWIFTDETMIVLNPLKRRVRVIRGVDVPGKFIETVGYPTKLMVWGAIGWNYKSNLIRITGTLNAERYQSMLQESRTFGQLNERYGMSSYVFQQDGARPHTAATTMAFLSANRVVTLPPHLHWPAMSPDLNVIENLWAILKSSMSYDVIKDEDSLYNEALRVWNGIPMTTVNATIADFHARLQACLAVRGECLNRYKNVVRAFRESAQAGYKAAQDEVAFSAKMNEFRMESQKFFDELNTERQEREPGEEVGEAAFVNEQTWLRSCGICGKLPDLVKRKCGLPFSPAIRQGIFDQMTPAGPS